MAPFLSATLGVQNLTQTVATQASERLVLFSLKAVSPLASFPGFWAAVVSLQIKVFPCRNK